jgi:hypothetical protein
LWCCIKKLRFPFSFYGDERHTRPCGDQLWHSDVG